MQKERTVGHCVFTQGLCIHTSSHQQCQVHLATHMAKQTKSFELPADPHPPKKTEMEKHDPIHPQTQAAAIKHTFCHHTPYDPVAPKPNSDKHTFCPHTHPPKTPVPPFHPGHRRWRARPPHRSRGRPLPPAVAHSPCEPVLLIGPSGCRRVMHAGPYNP